jgi:hypothetical protein
MRVAVMDSPLTLIDPAAPRRRNPIAIGANGDELRCSRGRDLDDWTRSDVANVLMALGETRRRHASHAHEGDRNSGERRMGHDISRPKVNMFEVVLRSFQIWLPITAFGAIHGPGETSSYDYNRFATLLHQAELPLATMPRSIALDL